MPDEEKKALPSCTTCVHFWRRAGHYFWPDDFDLPQCRKRPQMANLVTFPFAHTKCASYRPLPTEPTEVPHA